MELLYLAIGAAIQAGEAILRVYDTDFSVELKSDSSPLTLADRESHRILVDWLKTTGLPILSEEGRHLPYEERKAWIPWMAPKNSSSAMANLRSISLWLPMGNRRWESFMCRWSMICFTER